MSNLIPGAVHRLIDTSGRAARKKGRAVVAHVAVSNSKTLPPSGGNDWHAYLPKAGGIIQYVDLDVRSYATLNGNGSVIAWESEGGVGEDVNGPWTDGQMEAGAFLLAYANETEGTPLEVMPDSRPGSRGMGYHRLGVDPFRVAGGELWSSARGKVCPGPTRIGQIPAMVARARELRGGSPAVLPIQAPAAPAPAPSVPGVPGLPGWSLPRGHYYGHKAGPAASHGGYYPAERGAVQAIQRRFIAAGCVPGITDWRSGWADGLWEDPTSAACRAWFARYRPGQPYTDRIYSDDYAVLGR